MPLVPSEAWVEGAGGCVFEMQDAAAVGAGAAFRGVEDERGHEQDVARSALAGVCAASGELGDGFRGQAAMEVGTRDHPEGAVFLTGRIKMDADGDHACEECDRGLHVGDAVFQAPRAVAVAWALRLRADGEILVPGDWPVFRRGFVKKDGADGM